MKINEHWVLSLDFNNEEEQMEFHKLIRENKNLLKNWKITHAGYFSEFKFPRISIKRRK